MPRFLSDDQVLLHVEIAGADDAPAVVLVHGLAGPVAMSWRATGAVVGGAPIAVLTWTDADESLRAGAVAVLEGTEPPDPAMQLWLDFLDATGADRLALAALLRGHQPVVREWDRITVPVVVAAGVDDSTAAPVADVAARLVHGRALELPGDHVAALAAPAFTDAIVELAGA